MALGTARAEKTTLDEADGRWKLKMVIDYGSMPDINFVPMLFIFTPTMIYERACTDESKGKPILNKLPLQNQPTVNEQLDVGFSNGTGKTFKETHFDFLIRRDRGFEAGEYTLEIKRASDSKTVGSKIRLVLNGENKVVDRRAMTFAGDKPKKDDPCINAPDAAGGDAPPPVKPVAKEDKPKEDVHADGEIPGGTDQPGDGPAPVPPKQGGCGCELAPHESDSYGLLFAGGLGAAMAMRRRRWRSAKRLPDATALH